MKICIKFFVLLLTLSNVSYAGEHFLRSEVKVDKRIINVTYISNCGFLVQIEDKKILFDMESPNAAFDKLALLEVYNLMNENKPPFNDITAVLISHPHDDHFGVQKLTEYLLQNESVKLYSTIDTRDEFKKADSTAFKQIENNVIVVDPFETGIIEKTIEGLKIDFLGFYHLGVPEHMLKDLSFALEVNGMRILYLSDIGLTYEKNFDILKKWSVGNRGIDLLFSCTLKSTADITKEYIKPNNVIVTHIDPEMFDEEEEKVKKYFPDAIVFRKCMESRGIKINN